MQKCQFCIPKREIVMLVIEITMCLWSLVAGMPCSGKQKSNLQKSTSLKGLGVIYHHTENIDLSASSQSPPNTSGSSFLGHFASGFKTHIINHKQNIYHKHCKLSCAENSKATLCTKAVPPKTKMTWKGGQVTSLIAAVKWYNKGTVYAPEAIEDVEMPAEVPDDLD